MEYVVFSITNIISVSRRVGSGVTLKSYKDSEVWEIGRGREGSGSVGD